jgi:hypothetical protein
MRVMPKNRDLKMQMQILELQNPEMYFWPHFDP